MVGDCFWKISSCCRCLRTNERKLCVYLFFSLYLCFKWCVRKTWTAQLWLFMWMRSTANPAMARNMGQKAMATEVELARWVWIRERVLESSLKCEKNNFLLSLTAETFRYITKNSIIKTKTNILCMFDLPHDIIKHTKPLQVLYLKLKWQMSTRKEIHWFFFLIPYEKLSPPPLSLLMAGKLLIAPQITPTPPSLPRKQEAQMCVHAVGKQCMQQRRLLGEAM